MIHVAAHDRLELKGTSAKKSPNLSMANPNAIKATAVRVQAISVRSAAKNTLGSFKSDMISHLYLF